MEQFLMKMLETAGPLVAIVAFFIWRDSEREKRQEKRNTLLEDFIRTDLVKVNGQVVTAMIENTHSNERLCEVLTHKPCLYETVLKNEVKRP